MLMLVFAKVTILFPLPVKVDVWSDSKSTGSRRTSKSFCSLQSDYVFFFVSSKNVRRLLFTLRLNIGVKIWT